MEVTGTSVPSPRTADRMLRRGVSFADSLENELNVSTPSDIAEAKFSKRLERASTLEVEVPAVVAAEPVPMWLMQSPQDSEIAIVNTEDIMEEFLQDDDMLNLEVLCSKWRGLDESEVEAIANILPEAARSLILGEHHIQEYLSYRRQLNEKHNRKASVKNKMEQKTYGRGLDVVDEDEDGSCLEDESDHLGSSEPPSPMPSNSSRAPRSEPALSKAAPHQNGGNALARKSVIAAVAQRRMSMASPRLTQTGASIIGKEEPPGSENTVKRPNPNPDLKSRRSVVGVHDIVTSQPKANSAALGRRSSVAVKAGASTLDSPTRVSTLPQVQENAADAATPRSGRKPPDRQKFRSRD